MSPTIAVIGEIVADAVLPPDGIVDGVAHLAVHPGGGPANTAVALARLGTTARFAGRLSGGALGALCRAKLEASGVDLTTSVVVDNPATLAIARLDTNGAASYEFYTEGTADWGWTDDSLAPVIDGPYPPSGPPVAVHTGTLALALQPSGAVIENLLGRARDRMTISVDSNLRTLGAAGAFASLRRPDHVPIAPTTLVDTVGAGDSFHAGLLHDLAQLGVLGGRLDTLTTEHLEQALRFASRVAAVTCSRPGADPPWRADIE
jgi:fructokinase